MINEPDDPNDDQSSRNVAGIAEGMDDVAPGTSEGVADAGESCAPHGTADQSEEKELAESHLSQSGSNRDKRADKGNQTTKQDE